ncbi:cytochrome P450 2K1-like [Larimichthys crocea]|uniref:cytochrome P450 2K1-like n=1 Tax=Larimichthys crocea TaxID=215358 RepID=UPI000F5F56BD|nr:cytochrome P450 2K1-like [Larimichthys crocea]
MLEHLFQSCTSASLLAAIVGLLVLNFLRSSFSSQNREPPGPTPLPLLGNFFQVDFDNLHISLADLSKTYGSIFTVYLGLKKVVVLTGYKAVKEALVGYADEFANRDIIPIYNDFSPGHGIVFANGDSWKEMRRFTISTLKDFGTSKRISEARIIEECNYLIEEFEKHEGKPFDNSRVVSYAVANIISSIMYNTRFDYNDPIYQSIVERDQETIALMGSASLQIYNTFPWLRPILKNWKLLMKIIRENEAESMKIIANLEETLNPETCRCFVDAFLAQKQKLEESGIKDSHYHYENLLQTVTNIFAAGTDTAGHTLQWALLFMAKYPHIQDKVHEELRRVIGSRPVRVEDRKNLPYINAVIHESQRLGNVGPHYVPHQASQDVTLNGYLIKKGTPVLPIFYSVLLDKNEWEAPHTFNPSHFLDKDGKFIKRDAFMPFSAGRRVCVGEGLARLELFLFFTSLFQRFRFTPPPGVTEDELDLTPVVGLTHAPTPHKLCAISLQ